MLRLCHSYTGFSKYSKVVGKQCSSIRSNQRNYVTKSACWGNTKYRIVCSPLLPQIYMKKHLSKLSSLSQPVHQCVIQNTRKVKETANTLSTETLCTTNKASLKPLRELSFQDAAALLIQASKSTDAWDDSPCKFNPCIDSPSKFDLWANPPQKCDSSVQQAPKIDPRVDATFNFDPCVIPPKFDAWDDCSSMFDPHDDFPRSEDPCNHPSHEFDPCADPSKFRSCADPPPEPDPCIDRLPKFSNCADLQPHLYPFADPLLECDSCSDPSSKPSCYDDPPFNFEPSVDPRQLDPWEDHPPKHDPCSDPPHEFDPHADSTFTFDPPSYFKSGVDLPFNVDNCVAPQQKQYPCVNPTLIQFSCGDSLLKIDPFAHPASKEDSLLKISQSPDLDTCVNPQFNHVVGRSPSLDPFADQLPKNDLHAKLPPKQDLPVDTHAEKDCSDDPQPKIVSCDGSSHKDSDPPLKVKLADSAPKKDPCANLPPKVNLFTHPLSKDNHSAVSPSEQHLRVNTLAKKERFNDSQPKIDSCDDAALKEVTCADLLLKYPSADKSFDYVVDSSCKVDPFADPPPDKILLVDPSSREDPCKKTKLCDDSQHKKDSSADTLLKINFAVPATKKSSSVDSLHKFDPCGSPDFHYSVNPPSQLDPYVGPLSKGNPFADPPPEKHCHVNTAANEDSPPKLAPNEDVNRPPKKDCCVDPSLKIYHSAFPAPNDIPPKEDRCLNPPLKFEHSVYPTHEKNCCDDPPPNKHPPVDPPSKEDLNQKIGLFDNPPHKKDPDADPLRKIQPFAVPSTKIGSCGNALLKFNHGVGLNFHQLNLCADPLPKDDPCANPLPEKDPYVDTAAEKDSQPKLTSIANVDQPCKHSCVDPLLKIDSSSYPASKDLPSYKDPCANPLLKFEHFVYRAHKENFCDDPMPEKDLHAETVAKEDPQPKIASCDDVDQPPKQDFCVDLSEKIDGSAYPSSEDLPPCEDPCPDPLKFEHSVYLAREEDFCTNSPPEKHLHVKPVTKEDPQPKIAFCDQSPKQDLCFAPSSKIDGSDYPASKDLPSKLDPCVNLQVKFKPFELKSAYPARIEDLSPEKDLCADPIPKFDYCVDPDLNCTFDFRRKVDPLTDPLSKTNPGGNLLHEQDPNVDPILNKIPQTKIGPGNYPSHKKVFCANLPLKIDLSADLVLKECFCPDHLSEFDSCGNLDFHQNIDPLPKIDPFADPSEENPMVNPPPEQDPRVNPRVKKEQQPHINICDDPPDREISCADPSLKIDPFSHSATKEDIPPKEDPCVDPRLKFDFRDDPNFNCIFEFLPKLDSYVYPLPKGDSSVNPAPYQDSRVSQSAQADPEKKVDPGADLALEEDLPSEEFSLNADPLLKTYPCVGLACKEYSPSKEDLKIYSTADPAPKEAIPPTEDPCIVPPPKFDRCADPPYKFGFCDEDDTPPEVYSYGDAPFQFDSWADPFPKFDPRAEPSPRLDLCANPQSGFYPNIDCFSKFNVGDPLSYHEPFTNPQPKLDPFTDPPPKFETYDDPTPTDDPCADLPFKIHRCADPPHKFHPCAGYSLGKSICPCGKTFETQSEQKLDSLTCNNLVESMQAFIIPAVDVPSANGQPQNLNTFEIKSKVAGGSASTWQQENDPVISDSRFRQNNEPGSGYGLARDDVICSEYKNSEGDIDGFASYPRKNGSHNVDKKSS